MTLNSCSPQEMDDNGIERILAKQIEENKTPSIQYIIFNQDSVIHEVRLGFADIKNHVTATENTTYNCFFVTKTFTALSVLQLAQQDKIDINKPAKGLP